MIIIWQGLGILIGLILLVAVGIVELFFNVTGMAEYKKFENGAFFLVSGLLSFLLQLYLRESGELLTRRHTFFSFLCASGR
jgi:hypothetical protein